MKLRQFQVDAFTDQIFSGNPAAVVPLDSWLEDALLQAIAEENNLSETAFFVAAGEAFELRWFTPVSEVDLCGHATLAAAHIIFDHLGHDGPDVRFTTRSGELSVSRRADLLEMDFPARPARRCPLDETLVRALGIRPREVWAADDYLAVFDSAEEVRDIRPDDSLLRRLDLRGVIVTAEADDVDFVSRFFAPKYGIPEDPVTGSAHCTLAPYWSARLDRRSLTARQISKRGGRVVCTLAGNRVRLAGQAVTFMEAEIFF